MYPVIIRLIQQNKAIKKLFLEEIPKNHKVAQQPRARRIRSALKDKFTLPTLHFLAHVLEIFKKYEKLFQRSNTTIHLLYDKQVDVFHTTLIYFCKLDLIENCKSSEDILSIDFSNSDTVLPYEEISVGSHARRLISDFREEDKIVFFESIKKFSEKFAISLKRICHLVINSWLI